MTKKYITLIATFLSISMSIKAQCDCLNNGNPTITKTVELHGPVGSSEYVTSEINIPRDLEVGKEYRITTTVSYGTAFVPNSYITAENLTQPFPGQFDFTHSGLNTMYIHGYAPAWFTRGGNVRYHVVLKKKVLGVWINKDEIDIDAFFICPWAEVISTGSTANTVNSTIEYEATGYVNTSIPLAVTGTGKIFLDGGQYVTLLPGTRMAPGNGAIEAYIDGCLGLRHAPAGESEIAVGDLMDPQLAQNLEENTLRNEMKLLPNPTTQVAVLSFEKADEKQIRVFNSMGKLIFETTTVNTEVDIDLHKEQSGVYYVQVTDKSMHREVLKLIRL